MSAERKYQPVTDVKESRGKLLREAGSAVGLPEQKLFEAMEDVAASRRRRRIFLLTSGGIGIDLRVQYGESHKPHALPFDIGRMHTKQPDGIEGKYSLVHDPLYGNEKQDSYSLRDGDRLVTHAELTIGRLFGLLADGHLNTPIKEPRRKSKRIPLVKII